MVTEIASPKTRARRVNNALQNRNDHSTRLIWNGVSGCRQVEIQEVERPEADPHERKEREERVIGEVAEPMS